ncbi:MAG: DUF6198 family protein [Lachnospiraceae bacterium]|nr:DUF6198 family protein [Lachnospiraceae bacterium]
MIKKTWKEYVLFLVGLFISGVGVAITKKGELGVSPVSSVANIMSIYVPKLTLGNWLIVWNCVLILGQIIILGKKFQLFQLLQIPLSFLFGYFTDFGTWLMSFINSDLYIFRLCCVLVGTIVLAFGIAVTVSVNVIMNSGEAFVKAVSDRSKKEFGTVKLFFDISCVSLSVILSLIFFHGKILGTREGTIIAAVCTGICVKFFMPLIKKYTGR